MVDCPRSERLFASKNKREDEEYKRRCKVCDLPRQEQERIEKKGLNPPEWNHRLTSKGGV